MAVMTAEDKKWQAEQDARTLAEAEVIKGDEGRLMAAKGAAKEMADEKKEEAQAMSKIAGGKSGPSGSGGRSPEGAEGKVPPKRTNRHNVFNRI